jgi:hypothetical protein
MFQLLNNMRMPPNKRHSQHIDHGKMGCLAAISGGCFYKLRQSGLRAADSDTLLATPTPVAALAKTFNDRSAVCSSAGWR